jgi:uncharacterized protein
MKLDLTGIFDNSVLYLEFEESVEIDFSNINFNILNPVKLKGNIYGTGDGVFLEGKLIYRYSESCARCLTDVEGEIETEISGKVLEGEESILEESDEKTIAYCNGELLLDDVVTDAILLSMPMKIICKDDCKGLCTKCGKDLNSEDCTCEDDDIDPRLAKLRNFLNS